MKQADLLH